MKKVLFVCVENSCRSQMAEGLARHMGKGVLEAYSAGSKPSSLVNPLAITVMAEIGIDISAQKSKGFSDLTEKHFDYVVTLGCRDVCPFVPADKHIEWQIEDPRGKGIQTFREVREQIKKNLAAFVDKVRS